MPATLTCRHMEPLEQAGSRYDELMRLDQRDIFAKLLDHLSQFPDYCLLHFGSYEGVALRRMKAHMAEPYRQQIEDVLKHAVNILGIISPYVYFPTRSNSLKEIGRFLGCQWSDPSSSGVQTFVWRARWLDRRPIPQGDANP